MQRALDEQGVEYEVVKHGYGKGKRPEIETLSEGTEPNRFVVIVPRGFAV